MIVAHKTGTLLAVNDYYPFGLRWNGQGSQFHKYQFGGKEYEEELNLNTYDFHARQMDPVLGRFWGVDPMSSERVSFSPFNYVQNNPMSRVDPTGMLDNNRLNNERLENGSADDDNEIKTSWTESNLELLVGTEFEDMIGQLVSENNIDLTTVTDPTKTGEGNLGNVAVAASGFLMESINKSMGQNSTFRLRNQSGSNFSPKLYDTGWKGGSKGQIKTYKSSYVKGGLKVGGFALGIYSFAEIEANARAGKIDNFERASDHIINGISTLGGIYGAAWGVGWEIGKQISTMPGYDQNIRVPLQLLIGVKPN